MATKKIVVVDSRGYEFGDGPWDGSYGNGGQLMNVVMEEMMIITRCGE